MAELRLRPFPVIDVMANAAAPAYD